MSNTTAATTRPKQTVQDALNTAEENFQKLHAAYQQLVAQVNELRAARPEAAERPVMLVMTGTLNHRRRLALSEVESYAHEPGLAPEISVVVRSRSGELFHAHKEALPVLDRMFVLVSL